MNVTWLNSWPYIRSTTFHSMSQPSIRLKQLLWTCLAGYCGQSVNNGNRKWPTAWLYPERHALEGARKRGHDFRRGRISWRTASFLRSKKIPEKFDLNQIKGADHSANRWRWEGTVRNLLEMDWVSVRVVVVRGKETVNFDFVTKRRKSLWTFLSIEC